MVPGDDLSLAERARPRDRRKGRPLSGRSCTRHITFPCRIQEDDEVHLPGTLEVAKDSLEFPGVAPFQSGAKTAVRETPCRNAAISSTRFWYAARAALRFRRTRVCTSCSQTRPK